MTVSHFFAPKKIWIFRPWMQVWSIIALFIITVVFGYREFTLFGTLQGYEGYYPSIFFVPIYEEILFRGFVLFALLNRFKPFKAIGYSSLLFGLWHLKNIGFVGAEQVVGQILYTSFIIGPVFGYIAYKHNTVWPVIVLHYVHNLVAVYI